MTLILIGVRIYLGSSSGRKTICLSLCPRRARNPMGSQYCGEQDSFLPKMDYQTARYAAECARWYAVSGDEPYKEKATDV